MEEPCEISAQLVEEDGKMILHTEAIIKAFKELQPTEQAEFLELHGDDPRGEDFMIVEKWRRNCFRRPRLAFSGVFLKISRINHSCLPNSFPSYDGSRGKITARKDIAKDEEIVISYTNPDPTLNKQERQKKLEPHGFECRCQLCMQPTTTGLLGQVWNFASRAWMLAL